MINVAINGFGRIGRMVFRAGYNDKNINFIAVNDLTDTKTLAHLLQYDSVHGPFAEEVSYTADSLIIGKKKKIRVLTRFEASPQRTPNGPAVGGEIMNRDMKDFVQQTVAELAGPIFQLYFERRNLVILQASMPGTHH